MFVRLVLLLGLFLKQASPAQEKVMICVSKTAHAYHNRYCEGLNACTHKVESITLKEAIARDRDPCDYCYGKTQRKLPVRDPVTIQCAAITKAGNRCSRKAVLNGYCTQHSRMNQ